MSKVNFLLILLLLLAFTTHAQTYNNPGLPDALTFLEDSRKEWGARLMPFQTLPPITKEGETWGKWNRFLSLKKTWIKNK